MVIGVAARVRRRHLRVHDPPACGETTAVRGRRGHAQRAIEAPHEHRELATCFRSGPKLEFHDVSASSRGFSGRQVSWLRIVAHPGLPTPKGRDRLVGFAPRSQLRDSPGLTPAFPALRRSP